MKSLKYAAGIVLFLFVAYAASLHRFIHPLVARWNSQKVLSAASTPEQLRAAAGPFGNFYTFADGSWLAIRYRDSHVSGWSLAVARDSGGGWYVSQKHFCGAFAGSRRYLEFEALGADFPPPSDECGRWLYDLAASPDLATARAHLLSKYFVRL